MENLVVIAAAIGLVVVLRILAKMHRQNDELLNTLKDVTISIKKDTRSLADRTLKIEGLLEFVYKKLNQPARPISLNRINTKTDIKKALIVEDHPDTVEFLTLQLERLGFTVISASNGKEGVEKAIKEKPNLILMDIMMPVMDGREATRRIRSNPETKEIPVLAATAITKEDQLRECIEAGCNDYIVKPFAPNELVSRIEKLLM